MIARHELEWELSALLGIRVQINEAVPAGDMVILGNFAKPDDWATLSKDDQLKIAARHADMIVMPRAYARRLLSTLHESQGRRLTDGEMG